MESPRRAAVDAGGAVAVVQALAAGRSSSHRRMLATEWMRDKFWVLPSLLLAAGCIWGVLTVEAALLGVPARIRSGLSMEEGGGDGILAVIASSMLTFVGVVFTITLVALQLASAQLSPRVIRTFVRSGVTKLAFGIFLATFGYSMTVLVLTQSTADPEAESRAVTTALALVAASLVVFLVYVTRTMKLLQVSWVITAVANETRSEVATAFPPAGDFVQASAPATATDPQRVALPAVGKKSIGVVLGIDRAGLVRLAARHDCVLELLPRVGTYLSTGEMIFAVHGGRLPSTAHLLRYLELGRARSMYQDPCYGIRQLVDVATQALSPALNQATTAVQVIDRLEDILLRIASRPAPTGYYVDAGGAVRLVVHTASWEELLDLAFTEIAVCGASSPHVARRLLAAYDRLAADVPPAFGAAVTDRRQVLVQLVGEVTTPAFHATARRPDAMGLG